MSGAGSVVVRRQLGSKLRQLRLAAGKDVADVTEAGLGSKAKISRIETGKGPVRVADIRGLCWLYGADNATTDALAALAPGTQQEDWWEAYGATVVPDWFGLYAGLEAAASTIRCFEPHVVHGLLQTPEYAHAVISADPRLSVEVVDQRVRFRLECQQTKAQTTVVLGEAALRPPSARAGRSTSATAASSKDARARAQRRARACMTRLPFERRGQRGELVGEARTAAVFSAVVSCTVVTVWLVAPVTPP